jgi:hypothetical protein
MSRLDTSFLAHSNSSSAGLMTFHHTKRPALLATRGVPVLWLRTSSPEPNLGGGALRLGAIERRLKRPNPFYIVSIHPGLILGYIKTFVQRIPADHVAKTDHTATTRDGLRPGQVANPGSVPLAFIVAHANVVLIGNIGLGTIY